MLIDNCLNNIRCDVAGCNKFAKYNISTNSFKGNICLCEDCLSDLHNNIKQIKKKNMIKENL